MGASVKGTVQPWTAEELAAIRAERKAMGADFDLFELANRFNRSTRDMDLALEALLGRSAQDAVVALTGHGHRPRIWAPSGPIGSFVEAMFG